MRYALTALTLILFVGIASQLTRADDEKAPPPLDAVLRVKVDAKLVISCQFDLPGKADQSFRNTEYRCVVLDKDGVQVEGALLYRQPRRTIELPKDKRSVTDATDANFVTEKLKSGEEYYFVVSVRNLTGLAKFKAP
jgi:hypothetical protein